MRLLTPEKPGASARIGDARARVASLLGGPALGPAETTACIQLLLRCAYLEDFEVFRQFHLDVEGEANDPALLDAAERSVIRSALDASKDHPGNLAACRRAIDGMFGPGASDRAMQAPGAP